MWETFISWYINTYLGQYVENLNSQQLSFALGQGELELENVPLKKNIFRSWGLPVEVKASVVGRIKIEFNLLKYLRNEPVLITIEDIYLVAGLLNLSEWDQVEEELLTHDAKMNALDSHEARWKAQFDVSSTESSYYSSLYFSSMRIGASIVTKVVENLQLNVRNVHIRFEEASGIPGRVIAFGLTLEGLKVQSCDSAWTTLSSSAGSTSECSFKTLQVSKFGVYCDTRGEPLSTLNPIDLKAAMSPNVTTSHEYLLCPVTAEARIAKNNSASSLSSPSKPRFDVVLALDKVPLQLTDSQYRNSLRTYRSFMRLERHCRLRHYRPFGSVHGNVADWWRYAMGAVLTLKGYRRRRPLKTVEEVLKRARDNVAYVKAYEQHLTGDLITLEARQIKDRIEAELHYDEIIELREIVMLRIERIDQVTGSSSVQLKEKCSSTAAVPSETSSQSSNIKVQQQQSRYGIMTWLFPSWSSAAAGDQTGSDGVLLDAASALDLQPTPTASPSDRSMFPAHRQSESDFDEEILGDVKAFGSDALLARFNFKLEKGMISLLKKSLPFLEFDFTGVQVDAAIKPRSGSHRFQMLLSSVSLKDCRSKQLIVAPHQTPASKTAFFNLATPRPKDTVSGESLFSLTYEKKPHKKAAHRVSMTTRPLDLILSPELYEDIRKFFQVKDIDEDLIVHQSRYEMMKQKTKQELKIYWERLVDQHASMNTPGVSNWEIYLDIAAPQIIIFGAKSSLEGMRPQRMRAETMRPHPTRSISSGSSGSFVVIDLGRFRFTNVKSEDGTVGPELAPTTKENETENSYSDDDEEFLTPCSSPLPEPDASDVTSPGPSLVGNSDYARRYSLDNGMPTGDTLENFYAKLYKNYNLEITDIHVIVVDAKSSRDVNWRAASSKSTSPMHLVDKFSVEVQLERRLVYSEDPMWPALTIFATLPKLTFHVNEAKVNTLRCVVGAYFAQIPSNMTADSKQDLSFLNQSQFNLNESDAGKSFGAQTARDAQQTKADESNSRTSNRLLVAQFTVQHVCVDIQSRERNIAELQILGAKTVLTKRSGNVEINFVIQSLLLADAVQTFGPDFQLLLASHKHVCMDTVSGSLKDSEPTSPMSPQPPASPIPPKMTSSMTVPAQLHEALLTSMRSKWKKQNITGDSSHSPLVDTDALITADLTLTSSDDEMAILNVQFNNLDVIANQETWVEIFQFIQKLNTNPNSAQEFKQADMELSQIAEGQDQDGQNSSQKIQANFEFRRLNILLLRGMVGKDGDECARKIATATASDSKINLSLNKGLLTVEGSLGGLQMLNLTPEGQHHQRVLSVGKDPLIDPTYQPFVMGDEIPAHGHPAGANESALTFTYEKTVAKAGRGRNTPRLVLRMASVIYTHCPLFLLDLKKCISQFQEPFTLKLKSAAAQIALGLVRQDAIPSLNFRSSSNSLSGSLEKFDFSLDHVPSHFPELKSKSPLKLDIVLDSPVIVLPRNRNSPEVLVANLGQISVVGHNPSEESLLFTKSSMDDLGDEPRDDFRSYNIFVCDISLYSLNLSERWRMVNNLKLTYPIASSTTLMRAQELYMCDSASAIPILHNTVVHLTLSYLDETYQGEYETVTGDFDEFMENGGRHAQLHIQGRVVSTLKVSLTPKQYAQVLDSLGNIAANEDSYDTNEVSVTERRSNWKKEVGRLRSTRRMDEPLPLPSPTHHADDSLPIKSSFDISELIVELALPVATHTPLRTDSSITPNLTLSCSELSFKCDKKSHQMEMDICLKALKLEDTNVTIDNPRRILASSKPGSKQPRKSTTLPSQPLKEHVSFISKSCPDLHKSAPVSIVESPSQASGFGIRAESSSLPDELDPGMIYGSRYNPIGLAFKPLKPIRKRRASTKRSKDQHIPETRQGCPVTPPPSPRPEDALWDNLVHIKILMIDPKSTDFITKYAGTHKHTRVDFNTLEVTLTPETFACLRQFFSDASKHADQQHQTNVTEIPESYGNNDAGPGAYPLEGMELNQKNSETIINVRALMGKLARSSGTIAEAEVNTVHCELKCRGTNYFGVEGRLGSLEIRDLGPCSGLYPLKFAFQGEQALDFDYVRIGFDAKFRLKMSSIVCVHTNRFYTDFSSIWSALFGSSANQADTPMSELGQDTTDVQTDPNQNVRVTLDIQAGAPVIILPYSATSENLLIVDLGHISVKNKFIDEAPDLVLNVSSIDLIQMDLYSGQLEKYSEEKALGDGKIWKLHHGVVVAKSVGNPSFLKTKCALNLKMRRYFVGVVPESYAATVIHGTLSTVHCTVNSEKYKLVRGLLQYNIGEHLENTCDSDSALNAAQLTPFPRPNMKSKLELSIELELVNVILEVLKDEDCHLSRIDFLRSKFTFQSNSDGTKDVDLASQEILICDIRKEEETSSSNVASGGGIVKYTKNGCKNILQQSSYGLNQAPTTSGHSKVPLQAEVHYRQSQRGTNVTIVLNNMRLMLILDWWTEVFEFLSQRIVPPLPHQHQKISEKNLSRERNISPVLERSREQAAPITVSAGIVTKRAPVLDVPESTFELKMNVSSCELVIVENAAVWDSNAIILRSTAMLGYRPHLERPISCSLLECELFSCILGLESETALSILDPTNIQIELVRQAASESQGILDATLSISSCSKILKIQSPNLSLRLSYHDMKMFIKFMDNFSKEVRSHLHNRKRQKVKSGHSREGQSSSGNSFDQNTPPMQENYADFGSSGFPFDLQNVLRGNQGSGEGIDLFSETGTEMSASKLTPLVIEEDGSISPSRDQSTLCGLELRCNFLSLCVIDDCRDADVPLVEVGVHSLELNHNCIENFGSAECVLSGDYYNRALSGWEPFLEPWKCILTWQKNLIGKLGDHSPSSEFPSKAPELELSIHSRKVLDINVTSTLLNLYRTVSSNWSEDYQLQKPDKRRAPFVPFALKNETGSPLWFKTILSENNVIIRERAKVPEGFADGTGWIQVNHLAVQPFSFEGRVKLRHRSTHQVRTHQLVVRVDGWQEVTPVSVDKVGTYFRIANPVVQRRYGMYTELPPTRLVFEVNLEGAAQKLVTVRSFLQVKNSLPDPVELKLENTIVYPSFERAQTGGSYVAQIGPDKVYPIPLHSVWAHMWIRPLIPDGALTSQYQYCTKALLVTNQDLGLRECTSVTSEEQQSYRFCVAVKRDEFADDDQIVPPNIHPTLAQLMSMSKRANLITLKSPLTISNLLPHEVTFEIRSKRVFGHIPPGKDFDMTNIDPSEQFEIVFTTETYSHNAPLVINPSVNGVAARLKMLDGQKRVLFMTARVRRGDGGTLTIGLSCPLWVINKSGLPIVCKQEGISNEAAGQFQEHEVGRMVTPLLFSFATDEGSSEAMTLRVGNGLHKDSKPYWCRSFVCQNGTRVRKLSVSHSNNRPESVYMVGVEVKSGSGRYRDTKLVVISPRFVVDNRSSRRVQISQSAYATSFFDAAAQATHLTLPPDCNLPFHWPRPDRDQLLCVKLVDIDNGVWSGGFPIDNVDSFHVNIRDRDGNSVFLRIEIVLQGSTYFIILNDTDQLPPPFRIDNLGFVSVTFHQACVGEERLRLVAKAESSVAYALDEPTQPAHLTLEAPGGQSIIVNMDSLGSISILSYENFYYIALTATFPPEEDDVIVGVGMESLHLVLEVLPGSSKVTLAKKEPGKLSQLWRVSSEGLIEHEGSRRIREPVKQNESSSPNWVLDIAGSAPQPSQCVSLMLRRPEKRRASTQHWEFTNDGRLKLSMYANMYVQAKDGFGLGGVSYEAESQEASGASWKLWSDVVLGPPQPVCYVRTASGIHAEQAVSRQKLRGGSGKLNLEVLTDGPTRVIRICDEVIPPRIHLFRHTFEASNCNTAPKFRVKVQLENGLGISAVSCNPREELMYCKLSGIEVEWTESKESQIVKVSVDNLQIDNQLHESEKSVVMYIAAAERFGTTESLSTYEPQPAVRLSWESMKSKLNAHVFKFWELDIKPLNLILEERLLLKFCSWLGIGRNIKSFDGLTESDFEVQKAFTNTASRTVKRFYFGMLKVLLNQVRLSVLTSSKLAPELAVVKRRLGLTLIRFEDAIVDLDTFIKYHPFETFEFLWAMVVKHYRDELMSQAAVILGSTDFLGNPLGFVNDVSVGVSGLIYEGSVVSLMKNVTHGISNSAAKVTGSLGEALGGRTILDDRHEEERRRIKEDYSGNSAEHLYAGIKGLGHGFIGGITSIATQTYEGASNDGFSGLITGIGKGLVGTVTKPAVGILDLATGAASAIRDSSQSSSRMIPPRARPTRVVIGNGGLLPPYSELAARGQELLFEINDRNYKELFIGHEALKQDIWVMIASEAVTVFKPGKNYSQLLKIPMSELLECRVAELNERGYENSPYIEFISQARGDAPAGGPYCRPQVVCENEQTAKKVVQQVNYAKILYEEIKHSQKERNSNGDE